MASTAERAAVPDVTVYWRPMCGYCTRIAAALEAAGVAFTSVNIWEDRAQAEVVRRASGGDEIVPTLRIGERFFVNPRIEQVLAEVGVAPPGPPTPAR